MMIRVKYPSIENSYRQTHLEWVRMVVPDYAEWEVTEKVHGACFFIYMDEDGDFRFGKKTGFLGRDEIFFGHPAVVLKIGRKIEQILEKARQEYKEFWSSLSKATGLTASFGSGSKAIGFAIFGEICGGNYNHPDVPKSHHANKVQKGTLYSPDNEFYAFDIAMYMEDGTKEFLPMEIRNKLFEDAGILYAKPLFSGSLDECLAFDINFQSTIPSELGLPIIENNLAEGVVIKPKTNYFFGNGKRVILKNKNDKYQEQNKKEKKSPLKLAEELLPIYNKGREFITEARFHNVESHHGHFEFKDFKKLAGLYIKDLMEDFFKDHRKEIHLLNKKDWKQVTTFLTKDINLLLRTCLQR